LPHRGREIVGLRFRHAPSLSSGMVEHHPFDMKGFIS
jgi:hypothetical protein